MSSFNADGNKLGRVLALLALVAAVCGVSRLACGGSSCSVGRVRCECPFLQP